MPKIERWDNLPEGVRQHLVDRMRHQPCRLQSTASLDRVAARGPDKGTGSRTSDHSRSVVIAPIPRPPCSLAKPPKARLFDGSLRLTPLAARTTLESRGYSGPDSHKAEYCQPRKTEAGGRA